MLLTTPGTLWKASWTPQKHPDRLSQTCHTAERGHIQTCGEGGSLRVLLADLVLGRVVLLGDDLLDLLIVEPLHWT